MNSDDFKPGEPLPETARESIIGHFLDYVKKQGGDIDYQVKEYKKAGSWLADCIAAWCPQYLQKRFGVNLNRFRIKNPFNGLYPPPKYGLLIYGEVGRGKTFIARKIYDFYNGVREKYQGVRKTVFIYDTEFQIGSQIKGNEYLDDVFFGNERKIMFFDDIGNEEETKRFGNTLSGREIIRYRHICREKFGVPTVLTTNLNTKTLAQKYDIYVESRVFGDYRGIFMDYPKDRRKTK